MAADLLTGTRFNPEPLRESILRHIHYALARPGGSLVPRELFKPLSLTIRDYLIDGLLKTERRYREAKVKRLGYLSMEFLMGRWLSDNLCNLGLGESCRAVLAEFGVKLEDVLEVEPDAGLGNGGLGRLAACFLESLATMGTPFYIERPQDFCTVPMYGRLQSSRDSHGNRRQSWVDSKIVVGVPNDMPVSGYGGDTVNFLRLFTARASEDFDIEIFNRGDYIRAVEQKIASENISRVLYPSDSVLSGKELRLNQEYFLVACALRDILRNYMSKHSGFDNLPSKVAIQMNDTHPSLCVAELMRLLVDENSLDWDHAWELTVATLGYTNHTLLPEALEKWPVSLIERVLPRHTEIIFGINHQFLRTVARSWPGDIDRQRRMSIIEEGPEKQVRMANLAIVGSHAINGVSQLHSDLIKSALVPDFAQLWPERFSNKTNGVAPRRWILKANPGLSALLTRTVGEEWITDLERVRAIEKNAGDPGFREEFRKIKRRNKEKLAREVFNTTAVVIDPQSMFDVHVKRIHEYKRQLLNVMRVIHEYLSVVEDGVEPQMVRSYIFAGKAAPGYWAAKQIIKLINNLAQVVNTDPRIKDRIKVVFVPDYRVSLAEIIMPAADLSQQISTAGMEASGTGNMKLAMNGALTLGTLDGANIEIMEAVGEANIYTFGLTREDVSWYQESRSYNPREIYQNDATVRRVVDCLGSNRLCPDEPGLFRWIVDELLDRGDRYFHLADLSSYIEASHRAEKDYREPDVWTAKSILNVARTGFFSSDRTISEYAQDIWHIRPVAAGAQRESDVVKEPQRAEVSR